MVKKITVKTLILILALSIFLAAPALSRERKMKELYGKVLDVIYQRSAEEDIKVAVFFETTAFEIAKIYKEAETQLEGKEWINKEFEELIKGFTGPSYPDDSKAKDNLCTIFRGKLEREGAEFEIIAGEAFFTDEQWEVYHEYESKYIQEVIDSFNKHSQLTSNYHPDWGYQKYDRLVFWIYLKNSGLSRPYIADIGKRTFLEDDKGNIYKSEGLVGPYPYTFDKPEFDELIYEDSYRLYFPVCYEDKPIIDEDTKYIKIVIYDLGGVDEREFIWELPFKYPGEDLVAFE